MVMIRSRKSLQIGQITKINLQHNFVLPFLLAVFFILLTPIIFGTTNLDTKASAVPLEMFVALIGIILLTPIFTPEQNAEIEDIMASKYIDSTFIYLIRIAYSLFSLVILTMIFTAFMKVYGCTVTLPLLFGTIAEAMFLGALGLATAALISNIAVSYMIPMVYYALNFGAGSKLGNFYLFSMGNNTYTPKLWLFGTSVLLIMLAILTKWIRKKYR